MLYPTMTVFITRWCSLSSLISWSHDDSLYHRWLPLSEDGIVFLLWWHYSMIHIAAVFITWWQFVSINGSFILWSWCFNSKWQHVFHDFTTFILFLKNMLLMMQSASHDDNLFLIMTESLITGKIFYLMMTDKNISQKQWFIYKMIICIYDGTDITLVDPEWWEVQCWEDWQAKWNK